MTRSLHLASVNPSPAIRRTPRAKPNPTPAPRKLISSEARDREAAGLPFYNCGEVRTSDIRIACLAMTSYRPRVERKVWRSRAAVVVGGLIWLLTLGASGNVLLACLFGALAALGVAVSDGWRS